MPRSKSDCYVEGFVESTANINADSTNSSLARASSSSEGGSDIYVRAIDLLSRREHSVKELCDKLNRKFPDRATDVSCVCTLLQERGYLSDERFSEAYERSRRSKGFGPLRVKQELRGKGVSDAVIEELYDSISEQEALERGAEAFNPDLFRLWQKKFSVQPNREQKAKQIRFFLYRGFSMVEVERLFYWLKNSD